MFQYQKNRFEQPRQSSLATSSFFIGITVLFIFLFVGSTKPVQAFATYEDAWGVGDDAESQYIVGCGVAEVNVGDDWELHNVKATVTLRSPSGRSNTRISNVYYTWSQGSNFAARAEPTLIGDGSDIGDYTLNSRYESVCPVTNLGTAFVRIPVGRFRQTYAWRHFVPEQNAHWYSVDCIGPCTASYTQNRFFPTFRGNFYVCDGVRITFNGSTCVGRCRGSVFNEGCF